VNAEKRPQHEGAVSESGQDVTTIVAFRQAVEAVADAALALGIPLVLDGHGVTVLPDVIALQGLANGLPSLPDSWRLERKDGRTVYLFRTAEALGGAA
jgi:DNA-binding transcriptional LysR family regulator